MNIYAYILGLYYKKGIVLELVGKDCNPARNPFNGDKKTLVVRQDENDLFCYHDVELNDFKGSPFDFAALNYKLQGDELLEKLNQDIVTLRKESRKTPCNAVSSFCVSLCNIVLLISTTSSFT